MRIGAAAPVLVASTKHAACSTPHASNMPRSVLSAGVCGLPFAGAVPVMIWCVVACGVQVKCVRIFQEWEGLTPGTKYN